MPRSDNVFAPRSAWYSTLPPLSTYAERMLRATLRRAVGHGAEAPSLGLRLAPRWHGLSTVAIKRTLTLEEAMTSSHMILQTLESPTTVAQVGEASRPA